MQWTELDLRTCDVFYLTCDKPQYKVREQHLLSMLDKAGFKHVHRITGPPMTNVFQSGGIGFMTALEQALERKGDFAPFIFLEDDVELEQDAELTIRFPQDAELMYLGNSTAGLNPHSFYDGPNCLRRFAVQEEKTKVFRILNMLSAHAVVFNSARVVRAAQRALMRDIIYQSPQDIGLARLQEYYPSYCLPRPIFYQCQALGGHESQTRVDWSKYEGDAMDLVKVLPYNAGRYLNGVVYWS